MEFLSNNLPLILCGLAGFGLLLGEAFMPGFGVAGIMGIILEIIAIYSAWIHHGMMFALILTAVILVLIAVSIFLSYRSALHGRLSKSPLVLGDEQRPDADATLKALMKYQGQEGTTLSALRPAGSVEIGGNKVNAASGGGDWVEKGTKVRITGAEGDHVIVQPV